MTVFQVPASSGAPISMQSLMGAALSRANAQQQSRYTQDNQNNAFRNDLIKQGTQYGYNRSLVNQRTKSYIERQQNADQILRARNADQSMATYDVSRELFPDAMPKLTDTMLQNVPPGTLRQFTGYATVGIPAETRKGGDSMVKNTPFVSPGMRGVMQGALDTSMGKTANYIDRAPTPGGYGYQPIPGQRYQRPSSQQTAGTPLDVSQQFQPQATAPSTQYQYGQHGARVQTSPPVDPNNPVPPQAQTQMQPVMDGSQPLQGGASYEQIAPFSPAATNVTGSPLVDQGSIEDIKRGQQLKRGNQALAAYEDSGGNTLNDFNGRPIVYRSGNPVPNSIETNARSNQYGLLLENNDRQKLADWHGAIADKTISLKQTANAFRTIQDAFLQNPNTSPEAEKALQSARAQLDADFSKYANIAATQGDEAARGYVGTLIDNLRRGFGRYAEMLPATGQDVKIRQAFNMAEGTISLQIAKELNGGRPSDPDKFGIIQAMGAAMNDSSTLFSKQAGMMAFLANDVGSRVLATRDPRAINEFNDVYSAITGVDYDPRGSVYEGINSSSPRTNHPQYGAGPGSATEPVPQQAQPSGAWPYAAGGGQAPQPQAATPRSSVYSMDERQQIEDMLNF